MTELDIKHLLHRAKRIPWRWFRVGRDATAVCEQTLKLLQAEETLLRELNMARLTTDELRRQLDAERAAHNNLKDGTPTLLEAIRRLKGGKGDNGRDIPILNFRR